MSVANDNGVVNLVHRITIPWCWRHPPLSTLIQSCEHHFRPEPHQFIDFKTSCEILQIPQNLSVTGEPSRIPPFLLPLLERVISETHALPRQIGSERIVEARVDNAPLGVQTYRIRFNLRSVHPRASNLVSSLENHHPVPLSSELACRHKTGGAGTDHCHVARGEKRGSAGHNWFYCHALLLRFSMNQSITFLTVMQNDPRCCSFVLMGRYIYLINYKCFIKRFIMFGFIWSESMHRCSYLFVIIGWFNSLW